MQIRSGLYFLSLVLCLMVSTSSFGYFSRCEVLSNGNNRVVLFSDVHGLVFDPYRDSRAWRVKLESANIQRESLLESAVEFKAFVAVEDILFGSDEVYQRKSLVFPFRTEVESMYDRDPILFNPNNIRSDAMPSSSEISRDKNYTEISPLFYLSEFLRSRKIPFENVEFRFKKPDNSNIDQVETIYLNEIRKIETFDNGSILNSFYKEEIKKFSQKYSELSNSILKEDMIVSQLLIDLKLINSVASYPQETVFVCAGGEHIMNVRKILIELLKYESKFARSSEERRFEDPDDVSIQECLEYKL